MSEIISSIECDLEGRVMNVGGKFSNKESNEVKEITANVFMVIQDILNIKGKINNTGKFVKVRFRNDLNVFEACVGANCIKINQYKNE
jgi:hypothetical protein